MTTGKCFCGNVQYEIQGNILKSGLCHCSDCQRLTGGVAWPFMVIKQDSLIIKGDVKEFTRLGGSGQKVHMSFCGNCGSTLFGKPENMPYLRTVSASSLDDKKAFDPSMHVWTQDSQKGIALQGDIPTFEKNPG